MKKLVSILIGLSLVLLLTSCEEEKSDVEYIENPEYEIEPDKIENSQFSGIFYVNDISETTAAVSLDFESVDEYETNEILKNNEINIVVEEKENSKVKKIIKYVVKGYNFKFENLKDDTEYIVYAESTNSELENSISREKFKTDKIPDIRFLGEIGLEYDSIRGFEIKIEFSNPENIRTNKVYIVLMTDNDDDETSEVLYKQEYNIYKKTYKLENLDTTQYYKLKIVINDETESEDNGVVPVLITPYTMHQLMMKTLYGSIENVRSIGSNVNFDISLNNNENIIDEPMYFEIKGNNTIIKIDYVKGKLSYSAEGLEPGKYTIKFKNGLPDELTYIKLGVIDRNFIIQF